MTEHSPGPWEYSRGEDGEMRIYAPVFPGAQRAVFDIADVWRPETGDREANGRLIASAPDLLAGMKALYHAYVKTLEAGRDRIITLGGGCDPVDQMENGDPALIAARDLIAKAEGRLPVKASTDDK